MSAFWNSITSLFGNPATDTGLIGSKLSAVKEKDDFFVFFNFAPIGEENLRDGTKTITFKPTGDSFKALVTLDVIINAQDIIQKLNLAIARSFIDDPKKCIYSADLVKSFLAKAIHTSSGEEINLLAAEINARSMARSAMPMITRQPLPLAVGAPSAAYRTYAGNSQPQTLLYKSGRFQLVLANEIRTQEPVLDLVVLAKK